MLESLHINLVKSYKNAHPTLSHTECDLEISKIWKIIKSNPDLIRAEIRKWDMKSNEKKLTLDKYWNRIFTTSKPSTSSESPRVSQIESTVVSTSSCTETSTTGSTASLPTLSTSHDTPRQNILKNEIEQLKADVLYLEKKKSQGIISDQELENLLKYRQVLNKKESELKIKMDSQIRQQRKRQNDKILLNQLIETNPEAASILNKRAKKGRPRLEENQPDLLKTIIDIATYGAAADERRRSEKIRTVHTLEELTEQLNLYGFKIKKSAVYLRLLPRNSSTIEGKRHVVTVPVKLARARNDLHKEHADTKFCFATIKYAEEIASVLGSNDVLFLSQDDKVNENSQYCDFF